MTPHTNARPEANPPTADELAYMLKELLRHVPKRSVKHPAGFAANLARALLNRVQQEAEE